MPKVYLQDIFFTMFHSLLQYIPSLDGLLGFVVGPSDVPPVVPSVGKTISLLVGWTVVGGSVGTTPTICRYY